LFEAEPRERLAGPYVWPRKLPDDSTLRADAGYNQTVNQRSSAGEPRLPTTYRYPTRLRPDHVSTSDHSKCTCTREGETTTRPSRGCREEVLCTGDLFVWSSPNAGNPKRSSAIRANGPGASLDAELDAQFSCRSRHADHWFQAHPPALSRPPNSSRASSTRRSR